MGEGGGGDGAVYRPHLHAGVCRITQGGTEGGVGGVVGADGSNPLHLNDKQHGGFVSLLGGADEVAQMLHASLGGGVGEVADVVDFQSTTLDLHKPLVCAVLNSKIKAGIAVGDLPTDGGGRKAVREVSGGHGVGGLGCPC